MATNNKRLLEWARRYRVRLEGLTDEASSILTGGLRTSWTEMVDQVARLYRRVEQQQPGQYTLSDAVSRLEQVNKELSDWLPARSPLLRDLTKEFAKKLQQSDSLGLNFAAKVKSLVYPDRKISQLSRVPFKAVLEAATGIASRMWRYNEDLRIRSGQAIVTALVRGQGASALANKLLEFGVSSTAGVERIARTELSSAYVKAAVRSYEEDGVEYGQWAAVESVRTCPYCAARHMQVYELSQILIPAHPNCLCSVLPVSKERLNSRSFQAESWEDRQAILEELKATGRKPITSPTPFEKFTGVIAPQPVWVPSKPETPED